MKFNLLILVGLIAIIAIVSFILAPLIFGAGLSPQMKAFLMCSSSLVIAFVAVFGATKWGNKMKLILLLSILLTGCVPTHPRYTGVVSAPVGNSSRQETIEEAQAAVTNFQVAQWMNAAILQSRREFNQQNYQRRLELLRPVDQSFRLRPRYSYGQYQTIGGQWRAFDAWSY